MKIVLNKPKALNALDLQMVKDVDSLRPQIEKSRVFWMEGAGGKAFCAGGDVVRLYHAKIKENNLDENFTFFREEFSLDYNLSQMKSLQVANWDGIVMGGGVGISAFAPFIIASENSMYAMPEAKIGFFTDVGAAYFLSRLRSNLGHYLGISGNRLKGEDVYIAGLANYFIPREKIPDAYAELKSEMKNSGDAKNIVTKVLGKYHQHPQRKTLANEDKINEIFSKGSMREIYQYLQKSEG